MTDAPEGFRVVPICPKCRREHPAALWAMRGGQSCVPRCRVKACGARLVVSSTKVVKPMTTMREIAEQVGEKHGVNFNDMRGPRRFRKIVRARQETWARCRKETKFSLPSIGRFFKKDHTTVLYGVRKFETGVRRPG